jgi:hypothetical protein
MGGASSSTGLLDLVKFKSSTKTSSGEGDLSLEEEETLEAHESLSTQSGHERPSSTMPDVLISRLLAVGSFGFVLAMFVEYFFLIESKK